MICLFHGFEYFGQENSAKCLTGNPRQKIIQLFENQQNIEYVISKEGVL